MDLYNAALTSWQKQEQQRVVVDVQGLEEFRQWQPRKGIHEQVQQGR